MTLASFSLSRLVMASVSPPSQTVAPRLFPSYVFHSFLPDHPPSSCLCLMPDLPPPPPPPPPLSPRFFPFFPPPPPPLPPPLPHAPPPPPPPRSALPRLPGPDSHALVHAVCSTDERRCALCCWLSVAGSLLLALCCWLSVA